MALEKLELEHKLMFRTTGLVENACDSSIPLLEFGHLHAFFQIVTLDPDNV